MKGRCIFALSSERARIKVVSRLARSLILRISPSLAHTRSTRAAQKFENERSLVPV